MSDEHRPHTEAHAGVAHAVGSAPDAQPVATYTVPATDEAQRELGRRLSQPTKKATAARTLKAEARRTRARVLRDEGLPPYRIARQIAEEEGRSSPFDQRTVYRWLEGPA